MKQRPSRLKHSGKNLFWFVLTGILFLGPVALVIFIINRILYFFQLIFINKFKKYKVEYKNQITPFIENGDFIFKTNKQFKILQLTDIHIGGGFLSFKKDRYAFLTIVKMIIAEKPDLVIITGDISFPVFLQAGTFSNLHQHKLLSKLLNLLGVYWTFVFGNHDAEIYSPYSRYNIIKWYEKQNFKYCLIKDNPMDNISGYANQCIKIKNENNEVIKNLILLDSHNYAKKNSLGLKPEYDYIKEDQVNWSVNKVVSNAAKTFVFIHIPLVEYRDAYSLYKLNNNKNVKYISGKINKNENKYNKYKQKTWGINASSDRSELFNKLHNINKLEAVYCGHDHKNDLSIMYKGVLLSYCKPIDYLTYPRLKTNKRYRGCNVILIDNDKTYYSKIKDFYIYKYQKIKLDF